jgi:hypothetical protein
VKGKQNKKTKVNTGGDSAIRLVPTKLESWSLKQ